MENGGGGVMISPVTYNDNTYNKPHTDPGQDCDKVQMVYQIYIRLLYKVKP
jgi:hypothetical protein